MFQRILVPLDGSKHAERAIPVAAQIARQTAGELIFINVVLPPPQVGNYSWENLSDLQPEKITARRVQAEEYLTHLVTRTYASELDGIPTERDVEMGATIPTILATALLEHVDLIVMCSRGETGLKRWIFGSVAFETIRHTSVPILILHENGENVLEPPAEQPLRVLVPLDGTPQAETVLEPVMQFISALAVQKPATIHLLRVVDVPSSSGKYKGILDADALIRRDLQREATTYLQHLTEKLHTMIDTAHPWLITSSVVTNPLTSKAIIDTTESEDKQNGSCYNMVAIATHGRTGLQHLLTGSVTEQVLDHTKLPVFVIRSRKQETQIKEHFTNKTTAHHDIEVTEKNMHAHSK